MTTSDAEYIEALQEAGAKADPKKSPIIMISIQPDGFHVVGAAVGKSGVPVKQVRYHVPFENFSDFPDALSFMVDRATKELVTAKTNYEAKSKKKE